MSDPLYLQQAYRTKNEPKVHPLVRGSFAFVPSAGMRLAPEILVLELMRELFFDPHFGSTTGTKDLNPDEMDEERRYCRSQRERAVLYALRGRRKQTRSAAAQRFFAPAYPELARSAWLGKNRERVINNFFLGGPIAQHLWHKGPDVTGKKSEQNQIAETIRRALLGNNSYVEGSPKGKEILAVALGAEAFNFPSELPIQKMKEKTDDSKPVMRIDHDELSDCITEDTIAICELEARLPRMQWVQVLMTFLRFALPMWLLAQMRITRLLHAWLLDAVDRALVLDDATISRTIAERNRSLLHPTLTSTRELFEHIESYMKFRVELSILLYCLEKVRPNEVKGKILSVSPGGQDVLGVEQLLMLARDATTDIRATDRYHTIAGGLDITRFLTREGELFPAWRNPLMCGQGKNIDEFFRVLYRAELGDEAGGYLLIPEGRGASRGFRVFPGQLLLKTVTYLAAQGKWSREQRGGAGKLVLHDVEDRFGQYGVDFSSAADARPLLMRELQAMGLLFGSPDAGSSVAVACPY
jgi:hypothetical protein